MKNFFVGALIFCICFNSHMYSSYRFAEPEFSSESSSPKTPQSPRDRQDGSLAHTYSGHEVISQYPVMRSNSPGRQFPVVAPAPKPSLTVDVAAESPTLNPNRQSPVNISPSSYINRIATFLYSRAQNNMDIIASHAFQVIRDVAMEVEPIHHTNPLVRALLAEFNLLLQDGTINRELMRMYTALRNENEE